MPGLQRVLGKQGNASCRSFCYQFSVKRPHLLKKGPGQKPTSKMGECFAKERMKEINIY